MGFGIYTNVCFAADKAGLVRQGNKQYNKGKIDEALADYNKALTKSPDDALINFNIGNAFYKKKQYKEAVSSYEKALLSPDRLTEAKANYNIGNCKFRQGRLKEMADLEAAITDYRHSLDYYKRAMELGPKDKEAKFNHEFVEKLIKELLKKAEQQKKEKQDKQQQGQQEKKEDQNIGGSEDQKKQQEQQKQEQAQQQYTAGGGMAQSGGKEQDKEMSREQARMLLDDFRQQEAQDRRLNDRHRPVKEQKVEKDW